MPDTPLIFLAAGEPSGDAIGGRLMAALKLRTGGKVRFVGVGGAYMTAEGLESLFPMDELSVMGFLEVLPHARRLKRRIAETAASIERDNPDVIVTIDSPGFAKRVVDRFETHDIPRVHYVAPTVWAWKPGRVHAFKERFDRLLCLLPFEPPYFEKVGLDAPFVGHPVLESGAGEGDGPAFRARHGISAEQKVLCVLPGSRKGEVRRLLPVFGEAVKRLSKTDGGLHVVIPTLDSVAPAIVKETAEWPLSVSVIRAREEKYDAMAASDAALAASGTVALELALAKVPTVIAYRLNPITFWAIDRMTSVDMVHLLNIMANREIVPERLQSQCRPDILADDIEVLLGGGGAHQTDELRPYLDSLRPPQGSPSLAAADAVLEMLEKKKAPAC